MMILTERQVNEAEFLCAMLVAGKVVKQEEMDRLSKEFHDLDADGNGVLNEVWTLSTCSVVCRYVLLSSVPLHIELCVFELCRRTLLSINSGLCWEMPILRDWTTSYRMKRSR